MIRAMYSIYDTAVRGYNKPVFFANDADAIRSTLLAKDDEKILSKWPEQFILYRVGYWDDETGEFDHDLIEIGNLAALGSS